MNQIIRSLASLPSPKGLPLVGNLFDVPHERLHLVLEGLSREYGDLFTLSFGPKRALVTGVPEIARQALRERPHRFRRVRAMETAAQDLGLSGVFAAEGSDWQRQRRIINPAFKKAHLRSFHPKLALVAERLRRKWSRAAELGEWIDAREVLLRFTVDVTTLLAFEHDVNTLETERADLQNDIETVFKAINRRLNAPFPYWRYLKLPKDRAAEQAMGRVREVAKAAIERAKRRLEESPPDPNNPRSLLEALLLARDEEGSGARFTEDEIYGNVLTVLMAGEDTTANTIAWMLHEVAKRPDVQAKLREEALVVLGSQLVVQDAALASRLVYTTATMNEALRLRGPTPLIFLEPIEDVDLCGIAIPAGTPMILLVRMIGIADSNLTAPLSFSPERWLAENGQGRPNPKDQMPFGAGPRICPGLGLAYLEAQTVLSMVMRSFDLETDPTSHVLERHNFVMEPHGVRIKLRAREVATVDVRNETHQADAE